MAANAVPMLDQISSAIPLLFVSDSDWLTILAEVDPSDIPEKRNGGSRLINPIAKMKTRGLYPFNLGHPKRRIVLQVSSY